jgi:hypothetical protein
MHSSITTEEINTDIKKLEHMATDIWNIEHYRTKLHLSMFFVELKPLLNNRHIHCRIYTTVQNKIGTAQTQKGYCSMCKLSKIWTHKELLQPQTEMHQMLR